MIVPPMQMIEPELADWISKAGPIAIVLEEDFDGEMLCGEVASTVFVDHR